MERRLGQVFQLKSRGVDTEDCEIFVLWKSLKLGVIANYGMRAVDVAGVQWEILLLLFASMCVSVNWIWLTYS